MNILIVCATNSGGTYFAGEKVCQFFEEKGHQAKLVEANGVSMSGMHTFDLVVLGTNTWNYGNKEGQPHIFYLNIEELFKKEDFSGKKFAVFGLGDSSYAKFCESVDYLENMVKSVRGDIVLPSLKIDGYYRDEVKNGKLIERWVNGILQFFSK